MGTSNTRFKDRHGVPCVAILVFAAMVATLHGCGSRTVGADSTGQAVQTAQAEPQDFTPLEPVAPIEGPPSFKNFLHHFRDSIAWQDWAVMSRRSSAFGSHPFGNIDLLRKDLRDDHVQIPSQYLQYFQLDFLREPCKPWYYYTYKHPKPERDFEFYGFAKQRMPNLWLRCSFALHSRSDDGNYQHEAYLSTFNLDGKPIANYIWWGIEDADKEAMSDVIMAGDTIFEGHGQYGEEGAPLANVHRKILITQDGHFQVVHEYIPPKESQSDMEPAVWPCRPATK